MRYTKEQYENMLQTIIGYTLEAETHCERVIKRLEDEQALKEKFQVLHETLLSALRQTGEIEEVSDA